MSLSNPTNREDGLPTQQWLIEQRFEFIEALNAEKHIGRDRALIVALDAMNRRLDGMNEFRETLRDQNSTFLKRDEWLSVGGGYDRSIATLRVDLTRVVANFEQAERAATGERVSLDRRLDLMNEFRAQIKDVTGTLLPRIEADSRYAATNATLARIELAMAEFLPRKDIESMTAQIDARIKIIEAKINNWEGRMIAVGGAFLLANAALSWVVAGLHAVHP